MSTYFSQRREVGEFKKRYKWMAAVAVFVFLLLVARVVTLQVIQHDHFAGVARDNITKVLPLSPSRGLLRDTQGRVVADNRPSYQIYITPQRFDFETQLPLFVELMRFSEEEATRLRERIEAVPRTRWNQQIDFYRDVNRDQLAAIETHSQELPGVDVVSVPRRKYPFGPLAAHTVGYLNEVNADDLKTLADRGYRAGDRVGRVGLERAYEPMLRGEGGFVKRVLPLRLDAPDGEAIEVERQEPQAGHDITLALDMELMRSIDRAFRSHPSGSAVVVDAEGGWVRALYSKPAYDLNAISGGLSYDDYKALEENLYRPLIDKALYETYFPGSTFKSISALAGLGMEEYDRSQRASCPGYYEVGNRRFRCTAAHGEVDLRTALVESCNIYFWKLAEQVGLERLNQYARDFGFGEPTGIGINSEAQGFLPTRDWYQRTGRRFMVGHTMNVAIGQGNTRVTLLQMAMAYAAIANGGTLYRPLLVERIEEPDGTVVEEARPVIRREVNVAQESLGLVVDGLYGVLHDPSGTAFNANEDVQVEIAGKTGTAQVQRRRGADGEDPEQARYLARSHAWFAGFAPAYAPKAVVVVLVEHGGGGGRYAAPIATEILNEYLLRRMAEESLRPESEPEPAHGHGDAHEHAQGQGH